jgi:transposase
MATAAGCDLYRTWEGRLSPTMRQAHPAGERLFVDYAGQTVEVVDGRTGEVRQAQVFVAAMGASSYTYAEATWTQTLPDWIGSHTRALAFLVACRHSWCRTTRGSGLTGPTGTSRG